MKINLIKIILILLSFLLPMSLVFAQTHEFHLHIPEQSSLSLQLDEKQWKKLNEGEVLVFKNPDRYAGGIGVALASAPPWRIWQVITDYPKHKEFMPKVYESKVLDINENKVLVRSNFSSRWPFPKVYIETWKVHYTHYPNRLLLTWNAHKTNLKETFGFYNLEPHGEKDTLIIFRVHFLISWVPKPLVDIGSDNTIRNTLNAVRKRAKSKRYDRYPKDLTLLWNHKKN